MLRFEESKFHTNNIDYGEQRFCFGGSILAMLTCSYIGQKVQIIFQILEVVSRHGNFRQGNVKKSSASGYYSCSQWETNALSNFNRSREQNKQGLRNNTPFFGRVAFLSAGDLRQILPVVTEGTREDEINACV
ncbi:hypothetical protein TNCV_1377201 [Trichonephila clavipes]|nr:hypothetical protein TNCV_1377201 [Trichonephila clavipes]